MYIHKAQVPPVTKQEYVIYSVWFTQPTSYLFDGIKSDEMGKKQHSKDRMFITKTEWATEWGGAKTKDNSTPFKRLPFYCCSYALNLKSAIFNPAITGKLNICSFNFLALLLMCMTHSQAYFHAI